MKIAEWFPLWFERHAARHPRDDWPRPDNPQGREFWRGFMGNFAMRGVTEDVADEASIRLMADPPKFLGEHIPALLNEAKAIFRERAETGQGQADPNSREAAEWASKDCGDCCGQGLTIRWRKRSADALDAQGRPLGPTITLYCRCPLGRFFERAHRLHAPEARQRLHDLEEHPWLWGDEYRHRPEPSEMEVVPAPAPAF